GARAPATAWPAQLPEAPATPRSGGAGSHDPQRAEPLVELLRRDRLLTGELLEARPGARPSGGAAFQVQHGEGERAEPVAVIRGRAWQLEGGLPATGAFPDAQHLGAQVRVVGERELVAGDARPDSPRSLGQHRA